MKQSKTTTFLVLLSSTCLALTAGAADPYTQPDGSYISLSGEVAMAGPDSFVLDYGEGLVTVEMDDWDWYADGYGIVENNSVTVYGYVDDDLYETTSIEASSVYDKDLNTYFYASGADEESTAILSATLYDYDYSVTGKVTSVDGREFTLDTGNRKITVDTWQLGFNPLDNIGFLKVEAGDRVTVYGDLDLDLFDKRELSAETIIKLHSDVGKGMANATSES